MEKDCSACGRTYALRVHNQKYCSHNCGKRESARRRLGIARIEAERPCAECGSDFFNPDGRVRYCGDECMREARALRMRLPRYGLTEPAYRVLVDRHGNSCGICGQGESARANAPASDTRARAKKLAIDHDHTSGKVRGLLCGRCNAAIGLFGENPAVLLAAMNYLGYTDQILAWAESRTELSTT